MKITMYELLGMIKDGKAPKIIKYANYIWTYEKCVNDYTNDSEYLFSDVMCNADDNSIFLNDEVEILEEEKKIPEKLKIEQDTPSSYYYVRNEDGTKCGLTKHSKLIVETLNQVIDYLKSKGE